MSKPIHILGIAGSLRRASYNRAALRAATKLVPEGAVLEIFELDGIPLFNQDYENPPPAPVADFKAAIKAADAILIATPEYNFSVPGVLKNAIDWGSRPWGANSWDGKLVALMGASPGMLGTARSQYHLRQIFVNLNVHTLNRPEVLIPNAHEKFDAAGKLTDERSRESIRKLIAALVERARG